MCRYRLKLLICQDGIFFTKLAYHQSLAVGNTVFISLFLNIIILFVSVSGLGDEVRLYLQLDESLGDIIVHTVPDTFRLFLILILNRHKDVTFVRADITVFHHSAHQLVDRNIKTCVVKLHCADNLFGVLIKRIDFDYLVTLVGDYLYGGVDIYGNAAVRNSVERINQRSQSDNDCGTGRR